MRTIYKIAAFALAMTMILSASTVAFASENTIIGGNVTEEWEATLGEIEKIIVTNKDVDNTPNALSTDIQYYGEVNIAKAKTQTAEIIRCEVVDIGADLSDSEKISLADYILERSGYLPEEISDMTEEDKMVMLSSKTITTVISYFSIDEDGNTQAFTEEETIQQRATEPDKNDVGWMRSVLSHAPLANERIFVTNSCTWQEYNPGHVTDYISICVQNFSADFDSVYCRWSYDEYYYANVSTITETYDDTDSNFESIGDTNGAGVCFGLYIPASAGDGTITYDNYRAYLSCYFDNSSVLPGRTYNVYGNYASQQGVFGNVSFSFPWGISISGHSDYEMCKTQLQCRLE